MSDRPAVRTLAPIGGALLIVAIAACVALSLSRPSPEAFQRRVLEKASAYEMVRYEVRKRDVFPPEPVWVVPSFLGLHRDGGVHAEHLALMWTGVAAAAIWRTRRA